MKSERKACLKGLVVVCAGILALLVGFVTTGEAASYTFVKIADSHDLHFGLFPSLNNEGMVAYSGTLEGSEVSWIFRGNGEEVVTVADTEGEYRSFGSPSIADGDQVAFWALLKKGGSVILRSDGATPTTIAAAELGSGFYLQEEVSINNSGRVAFQGISSVGVARIFASVGDTPTTIAISNRNFLLFGGPAIDDAGTVVFKAWNPSSTPWGIYTGNGGSPGTLANRFLKVLDPSVSDSGIVAFQGIENGQQRIFKHDGATLTIVADTSEVFDTLSYASVNDEGVVAFWGVPRSTGKAGIFTGPDLEKDKVIAAGDALFGSTVSSLIAFGPEGLNNAGQVAFYAQLADGTVGIYRADPMPDEIPVIVDVKPGDDSNVINRDSHGVVPVAILSTESFDARSVDPEMITLANASASFIAFVKVKKNGTRMVAFEDVNEDGLVDLVFHVSTQDLKLEESDTELVLKGQTLDKTLDGKPVKVKGSDSVQVIH